MGYATEQLTSIPFGQIVGGPLVAGIEAQGQAARATVQFLADVGFKNKDTQDPFLLEDGSEQPNPEIGEVRTISFTYKKIEEGAENNYAITVPLLTVVPIPYFAIDKMVIDFLAKINETVVSNMKKDSTNIKKASAHAKGGWGPFSAGMKGSLSTKHSSSSATSSKYQTEMTMNVHVEASQHDMPKGLSRILDMLSDLVTQNTIKEPTNTD